MALSDLTMLLVMSERGGGEEGEDVLESSPSKSELTADSTSSLSLSVLDPTGESTSSLSLSVPMEHDKRVLGSEHGGITAAESDDTALIASSSSIIL